MGSIQRCLTLIPFKAALMPMRAPFSHDQTTPLVGCPLPLLLLLMGLFSFYTLRFFFFLAFIIEIEPSCLFIIAVWWSKSAFFFGLGRMDLVEAAFVLEHVIWLRNYLWCKSKKLFPLCWLSEFSLLFLLIPLHLGFKGSHVSKILSPYESRNLCITLSTS